MAEFPADLHAEIEKYERKHADNPDGRYFLPLANTYRKLGQLERAERLLREGLKRHPDYLSAHIVLGRTLADRGAAAEARAEFQHVLAVDPQNLIALRTLGELAVVEGRSDDAAHWYRELLAVDPMNDEARQALAELEGTRTGAGAPGPDEEAEEAAAEPRDEEIGVVDADRAAMVAASVEDLREPLPTPEMAGEGGIESGDRAVPDWVESLDPFLGDSEAEPPGDLLSLEEPADRQGTGAGTATGEPATEAADFELVAPDAVEEEFRDLASYGEPDADAPDAVEMEEFSILPAYGEPAADGSDAVETEEGDDLAAYTEPAADFSDAEAWDAPLGDEPEDLASETLAELYARQGFTQQAANMYRQLIRRRGEEPALLLRLAELEAAEAAEAAAAEAGEALEAGTTPPETVDASLEEPPLDLESLAAPEPPGAADLPFAEAGAEPHAAEHAVETDMHLREPGDFEQTADLEGAVERDASAGEAVEAELAPVEAELQPGVEDAALEEPLSEAIAGLPELARDSRLDTEEADFEMVRSEQAVPGRDDTETGREPGDTAAAEATAPEALYAESPPAEDMPDVVEDSGIAESEPGLVQEWEAFPGEEEDTAVVEESPTIAADAEALMLEPQVEDAPFAESFRFGFAGSAEAEPIVVGEPSHPAPAADWDAEPEPIAELVAGDRGADAGTPLTTIGQYFTALLAWGPVGGEAVAGPSPSRAAPAAPEPSPTAEAPGADRLASGDAAIPSVEQPEQELFPWEVPGSPAAGAAFPDESEPEQPPHLADTLREGADGPAFTLPEDTPVEPQSHPAGRDEPSPFATPAAEEDDDLESFQAWLRSLKR